MASRSPRLMIVGLLAALSVGGCAYDDGYGYSGVSVGTGYYAGNYYGPGGYYDPGYYGGWYNDFYYPGTGYYVIDRSGRRHRWNDRQRSYWEARRQQYRGRDQAQAPNGSPGRYYDRRAGRRPDGQDGRGFEGRGRWRQDARTNPVEGAQTPQAVRPERPAFRDRPQTDTGAGVTRTERPRFDRRAEGWRGSGRESRQARPQ